MSTSRPGRVRRLLLRLLLLAVLVAGLAGAYGLHRGMRYPPLQFDPTPRPTVVDTDLARVEAEGAYLVDERARPPKFRAFVPEPVLHIRWRGHPEQPYRILLENVHPQARFEGATDLNPGALDHYLDVTPPADLDMDDSEVDTVRVHFPERERYRFMAIGDAGGGEELVHCIDRARELEADFILHLGDIGYEEGDLGRGITAFGDSSVPIYAAIGNHDFHGGFRYRFKIFQQYYGPRNSWFRLAGVDFLNLDTAADTIPVSGGQRGLLLAEVRQERAAASPRGPLVAFTHRPLEDPRTFDHPNAGSHALNREGETEWLRKQLQELGAVVLLAGHVHESHDFTHQGLRQIISGEGLGERGEAPRVIVGEFPPGGPVEFHWEPL